MRFHAKVLNDALQVVDLQVDAVSEQEARKLLATSGGRVVELRTARRRMGRDASVPKFNLAVFNQQLYSLLDAGQTVVDSIDMLGANDKRGRNRAIYDALLRELKDGNQLSDAMESLPSVFPSLYVAMVRSSETTGTIRESIERFMRYQKQVDDIRQKVVAATTYPAVLLAVGFLVISFLMLYVLPRFSEVYDDAGTMKQGAAGFVQLWGSFVRENQWLAWGSFLGLVAGILTVILHPSVRSLAYRRLLALPLVGERIWVLQLARLYRTLGMLLHSGVSVLAAMRMTRASLPQAMHANLERAIRMVSEGSAMSMVMQECGMSTEVSVRLLLAGESSGNLDEMMGRVADFYDQETALWIDATGRLIEPVLMLGIGFVVGAIVLLLYSPIFDLANIV
ncbi:type II secretion system F family protein [Pseudoduganella sp.]|uniref:type II secretion system F family protein n=1 Tax=Pseudoduganella sp. TaxID=1880898 RepID=UPI0035B43D7F